MDVYRSQDVEGQNVIAYPKHNGLNQKWSVVYVKDAPKAPTQGYDKTYGFYIGRPFVLVSQLPMNYVASRNGSYMRLRVQRSTEKDQQWYFDQKSKTLKSVRAKNLSMHTAGGRPAMVYSTTSRWMQIMYMRGEYLTNTKGRVLQVRGSHDNENE